MSRPEIPACGWSTSRMMVDNLQAQLAPIERYGAAELALPLAIGLRALVSASLIGLRISASRVASGRLWAVPGLAGFLNSEKNAPAFVSKCNFQRTVTSRATMMFQPFNLDKVRHDPRLVRSDLCAQLAPLNRYGLTGVTSALVDGARSLFGGSRRTQPCGECCPHC